MKRKVELIKPREVIHDSGLISPNIIRLMKILNLHLPQLGYRRTAEIFNIKQLNIGGQEGSKYACNVRLEKSGVESRFIVKEYPYSFADYGKVYQTVNNIIRSYSLLRSSGYFVPQTTRLFDDKRSKSIFLLLSDITSGGKFRIWGFSDDMLQPQRDELRAMNLGQQQIEDIFGLADRAARKAANEKIWLAFWFYHIVQDVDSNNIKHRRI